MGRRLALLVATYRYQDSGLRQLTAPAHDAEALAEVLRDPEIAGFEVTTLINEPHHKVGEAIGDFYRDRQRDDLTLLYFTGHGLKDDEGRLYLAMSNTRRDSLLFTGLAAEQIDRAVERCNSRQKVLILDCCYSGAFPAAELAKGDTAVHTLERFQGRGRTVLTASDAMQYSFEGDQPRGEAAQSVFTRYLVAGLRDGSADLDGDGDITVDELYSYVHDRVVEEMPQQRPKKQDNVEGRTVIARNVGWTLPVYLRNALASPIATDRLSALDGLAHLHRIGNDRVRDQVRKEISRLADDDSKLVSAAAATRLTAIQPPPPEPPAPPEPPPVPEPEPRPAPVLPESLSVPVLEPPPVLEPESQPASDQREPGPMPVLPESLSVSALEPPPVPESEPQLGSDQPEPRPARPPGEPPHEAAPPASTLQGEEPWAPRRLLPRTGRVRAAIAGAAVLVAASVVTPFVLPDGGHAHGGDSAAQSGPAAGVEPSSVIGGKAGKLADLVIRADGKPMSVGADGTVQLWNPSTKKATTLFTTKKPVAAAAFSPDGHTLGVVQDHGNGRPTVALWDVDTHKSLGTITDDTHADYVANLRLAFSRDGKALATANTLVAEKGYANPVRLWKVSTRKATTDLLGDTNGLESIAFSPDGKYVASGAVDNNPVRVWEAATGKVTASLTTGYAVIHAVRFSADGRTLIVVGNYSGGDVVEVWDLATSRRTGGASMGGIRAIGADPVRVLAVAVDGGAPTVWDVTHGRSLVALHDTDTADRTVLSPDGKVVAIAHDYGAVALWKVP